MYFLQVFRQKKLGNTLAGFVVGFPYHGSEDPTNTTDKSGKQVLQFIKEMSLHGQMLAHSYTFSTERCTSKVGFFSFSISGINIFIELN